MVATACAVLLAAVGMAKAADEPSKGTRVASRSSAELLVQATANDDLRPACKTPRMYVDLLGSGRYEEIGALYADNAVYYGPDGKTRHGRKEIADFYTTGLPKKGTLRVYATSYLQDGKDCIVELAGGYVGDKQSLALGAIDHFTVNADGKIERFIMFISPPASMPSSAPVEKLPTTQPH